MTLMNLFMPWNGDVKVGWMALMGLFVCYLVGRVAAVFVPAYFWVNKSSWARDHRVYKVDYRKGQITDELNRAAGIIVLDAILFVSAVKLQLARISEQHVFFTFVFSFVWFEIWVYALHRTLHNKYLYRFHRLHHRAQVVDPFNAMALSYVERAVVILGLFAPLAAISYIYPISFVGVGIYFVVNHTLNAMGHLNVEFIPPWPAITSWFITPTHHSLHHSRVKGHFGLHTRFMDRLFNTEFEDYEEVHQRTFRGESLTSLGQRLSTKVPTNLVAEVRLGRKGLCDVVSKTDLSGKLMYEQPNVTEWLAQELPTYAMPNEINSVGDDWYLSRQGQIHGPMTAQEIYELDEAGALQAQDICFSLHEKTVSAAKNFRGSVPSGKIKPLFFSRRQKRTKIQCVMKIWIGPKLIQGITLDLNLQSAAVYVKVASHDQAFINEEVVVEIPSREGLVGLKTKAIIVHSRSLGGGMRYGLRFDSSDRLATARLRELVSAVAKVSNAA